MPIHPTVTITRASHHNRFLMALTPEPGRGLRIIMAPEMAAAYAEALVSDDIDAGADAGAQP